MDDRNYVYFGPTPAVLRIPFVLAGDWFDHRLARVSLMAAFVATMSGACGLSWRIRSRVQGPDAAFGPTESLVTFVMAVLLGAGSTLAYLASVPWAYQEAVLWGLGLGLWSMAFLLDHLAGSGRRALVLAAAFATGAISARGPTGSAAVTALAVVAGVGVLRALAPYVGPAGRALRAPARWFRVPDVPVLAGIVAVVVPVVTYATVNIAKFGSPFRLPIDSQIYISASRPARVAALEANGGSLFGAEFLPTNLIHYLRPDGFDLTRLFPFFVPPRRPPTIIGDVVFDGIEPAASITATMPVLFVLAVLGAIVVWRRQPVAPGAADVRALVIGGVVATFAGLSIAWNTQRYQGDFLPLLVVCGLVGLHRLLRWRPAAGRVGVAWVARPSSWRSPCSPPSWCM